MLYECQRILGLLDSNWHECETRRNWTEQINFLSSLSFSQICAANYQWHVTNDHTCQLPHYFWNVLAFLVPEFRVRIGVIGSLMFPCGLSVRPCWAELKYGQSGSCGDGFGALFASSMLKIESCFTIHLPQQVLKYGLIFRNRFEVIKEGRGTEDKDPLQRSGMKRRKAKDQGG